MCTGVAWTCGADRDRNDVKDEGWVPRTQHPMPYRNGQRHGLADGEGDRAAGGRQRLQCEVGVRLLPAARRERQDCPERQGAVGGS